jgi:hypothetical protein
VQTAKARGELPTLVLACIAVGAWCASRGGTAIPDASQPVPAKPSLAAVTAFYRRAEERTAELMGTPVPQWNVCPSCKLAFHGPDTLAENPATGLTPGDWQAMSRH